MMSMQHGGALGQAKGAIRYTRELDAPVGSLRRPSPAMQRERSR